MYPKLRVLAVALVATGVLLLMIGCGSTASSTMDDYSGPRIATESVAADSSDPRGGASYASRTRSVPSEADAAPSPQANLPDADDEPTPRGQQLIYTGGLVLAIYDVEATQSEAVATVEDLGGYVAERSSNHLIARVPAEKFREALQALENLGDVLDKNWKAQDVTDQMRDLDIRLRNAMQLRDRLEQLLEEVETIEEALKIESELERITLEIERIRGTLRTMEDRIAYSTIQVTFDAIELADVPDDEFLLPFNWLYNLGLESLLRAPEMYR